MLIILIFHSTISFIIIFEWVRVWVRVMGLQRRARLCRCLGAAEHSQCGGWALL